LIASRNTVRDTPNRSSDSSSPEILSPGFKLPPIISIAMARAIRVVDGILIDLIPRAALIAWSEISTLGDGGVGIRNLVNYEKEMIGRMERVTGRDAGLN
jgi:hypothetical protein